MSTLLFNILCDETGNIHTALLLHVEIQWLSERETCAAKLLVRVAIFFMENYFYIKWQTNVIQIELHSRHFPENHGTCYFKENN